MSLQQICADVNKVKHWGQQVYLDSRNKMTPPGKAAAGKLSTSSSSSSSSLVAPQPYEDAGASLMLCFSPPPPPSVPLQPPCPLQPPLTSLGTTRGPGRGHTFPPINRSTVWTTSSGVCVCVCVCVCARVCVCVFFKIFKISRFKNINRHIHM